MSATWYERHQEVPMSRNQICMDDILITLIPYSPTRSIRIEEYQFSKEVVCTCQ